MHTNTETLTSATGSLLHKGTLPCDGCDTAISQSRRAVVWTLLQAAIVPVWASTGPAPMPAWAPVDRDLWMLQSHAGDATVANRGLVANLLLAREGDRLWLIGSGPSPAIARHALPGLRAAAGDGPIELISPWAHPESVLGVAGLAHHRHWSHADVAQEMQRRCPGCLQRLAVRMGSASEDLTVPGSPDPIRIPEHRFSGEAGALGPFDWHRRHRAEDVTVIVWRHRRSGLVHAPGLVWGDAPPDGRDADTVMLAQALRSLRDWGRNRGVARWVGQQGGVVSLGALEQAAAYWEGLNAVALEGQDRGDDGLTAPRALPGVPSHWMAHPVHALNWQRAWRQAESRWLQRSFR